ncbi:MAG TPA: sulfotransferase [Mycobacteriales bacterium]|nr:sulfotransferase [Mycobacteriales bacterium]
MTRPNFLILGAARCGTTSLHYYLAEHPDVCMSSIKEPNFFLFEQTERGPRPCIGDDRRLIAKSVPDPARYERLFTRPAIAVGEASPLYLYTRETPALIRHTVPAARLVAVVREPVERAWSHFVYVNDDLGEQTVPAFREAVDRELGRPYEPYLTGTHFVRLSAYAEQLDRYRSMFPAEQLLVVAYDDLIRRTPGTLARICRFLGVDDNFGFDTSVQYNPSSGEGSWVARLDRIVRPTFPYLKKALPASVTGRLARSRARLRAASRSEGASPVPDDLRARLNEHFAPDREWLAREAGITFAPSVS